MIGNMLAMPALHPEFCLAADYLIQVPAQSIHDGMALNGAVLVKIVLADWILTIIDPAWGGIFSFLPTGRQCL